MEQKYKVNDRVMYMSKKIYRITSIEPVDFGTGEAREYYILKDARDEKGMVYLPVESEEALKNIRHLLTAEQINQSIDSSIIAEYEWVLTYKERVQRYYELLRENDMEKILTVIKILMLKKAELEKQKKQLPNVDAMFLQDVLQTIKDEFSYVLGIKEEEVVPYILNRVNAEQ